MIKFDTRSVEYKAKNPRLSLTQPFLIASYHEGSLSGMWVAFLKPYYFTSPLIFLLSPLSFLQSSDNIIALLKDNFCNTKLTLSLLAQLHQKLSWDRGKPQTDLFKTEAKLKCCEVE